MSVFVVRIQRAKVVKIMFCCGLSRTRTFLININVLLFKLLKMAVLAILVGAFGPLNFRKKYLITVEILMCIESAYVGTHVFVPVMITEGQCTFSITDNACSGHNKAECTITTGREI